MTTKLCILHALLVLGADGLIRSSSPVGVSALAGLATYFPQVKYATMMGEFMHPHTNILLDFGPVLRFDNATMFLSDQPGDRNPNPNHLQAVKDFLTVLAVQTPNATSRHVSLYMLNGPGMREYPHYDLAYNMSPQAFNEQVVSGDVITNEVSQYTRALLTVLRPLSSEFSFRLVVMLEDNLVAGACGKLQEAVRKGGWPDHWPVGRNVCPECGGSGTGDSARVGDFWERHPNNPQQEAAFLPEHKEGDMWTNDGWVPKLVPTDIARLANESQHSDLFFSLWYNPLQGYTHSPLPSGQRVLVFDDPPATVAAWVAAGMPQAR